MKMLNFLAIVFFFTILLYSQNTAYLKGQVIYVEENNIEEPQRDITVVIVETGDRDKTDNNGIFKIYLNQKFKPGDNITLVIEKEGWTIRDPLFGKTFVPSDLQKGIIKLSVLPKGSPLFFSDQQIKRYIEYLILKQSTDRAISKIDYSKITLESLLDTMAISWGFGISEIKSTVSKWIEKALEDTNKFYERGLAEYANKNFEVAGTNFKKSSNLNIERFRILDEDFKNLSQKRQEIIKETIRDLNLAGESYYRAALYDSALVAYKSSIEFLNYTENWDALASNLHAIVACHYYISWKWYDKNTIDHLDSSIIYINKGLDLSILKKLDEWELMFKANRAMILSFRNRYTEDPNKFFEELKNIRINQFIINKLKNDNKKSEEIYTIINNLGLGYHKLYDFVLSLNDARQFLDSAIYNYLGILNVSDFKHKYSYVWAYTLNNYALASTDIGYLDESIPSFYLMIANRIERINSNSFESIVYHDTLVSFIKLLNDNYDKFLAARKIFNRDKDLRMEMSVLNNITKNRIRVMLCSNDHFYEYSDITDSLIMVATNLISENAEGIEEINAIENNAVLTLVKAIYNPVLYKEEVIKSNYFLLSFLTQNQMLIPFENEIKRVILLNYYFLASTTNAQVEKEFYRREAYNLGKQVIDAFKSLCYYRDFEEANHIQKIILNSE